MHSTNHLPKPFSLKLSSITKSDSQENTVRSVTRRAKPICSPLLNMEKHKEFSIKRSTTWGGRLCPQYVSPRSLATTPKSTFVRSSETVHSSRRHSIFNFSYHRTT